MLKLSGGKLIRKKNTVHVKDIKEQVKTDEQKLADLSVQGAVKSDKDVILPTETAKKMQKFINFKFE